MSQIRHQRVDGHIVGIHGRSLMLSRQETVGPKLRANYRQSGTQDDKRGEVFVFGAQAVGGPSAQRGARRLQMSGMHHDQSGLVVQDVGMHPAENA